MTATGSAAPPRRREALLAWIASWAVRALAQTWRVSYESPLGITSRAEPPHPCLFVMWHGELLPTIWSHRGRGIVGMVSAHGDGEILTRAATPWGFRAVRGSTTRGAGRVLLAFVRELRAGRSGMLTPDGPTGPAGVAQPGALLASLQSGVPIVPVRCAASRAWRLRNWDRFMIPKPFAAVSVRYGEPWWPTAADAAGTAELARRLGSPWSERG